MTAAAQHPEGARTSEFAPGRRVPLRAIIGLLRHGAGDPTWMQADGGIYRASRTPVGPGTLHLQLVPDGANADRVIARAWGPGAQWLVDSMPNLLGAQDDPSGFEPLHDSLTHAWKRHRDWRMSASGLVLESLIPAIIEQRVTGRQAVAAYRILVRRYGEQAPGPIPELVVPPTVRQWQLIPSWAWLKAGVDAQRSDTVMRALSVANRLEECVDLPREQAWRRLRGIPGVGVWTTAETVQRALGDVDAVSFGDYHVAKDIGWALTGEVVDDAQLAVLLQPYAGHRYRVQHLVQAAGLGRPRRGPRLSIPTHLPR